MSEATWGNAASPDIDWRMSAILQSVTRGDAELPEVTSLEGAVRAWLALDADGRAAAILTPERAVMLDGAALAEFAGGGIAALADRLPGAPPARAETDLDDAG